MLSIKKPVSSFMFRALTRSMSHEGKKEKPFDKILIANRGEIACRVIRTCKKLGVKTVAVYSEADSRSMHVTMADEAYCIGGPLSKDSYLKGETILKIAKETGAQGIHPGYGFLSENAQFADMVEAAGIAFIGPSSQPMRMLGDKINSKKVAVGANCFIVPGFDGEIVNEEDAIKHAKEIGYPVMLKASAGGGGKGMRVAHNDDEVREGFRLSKAEAAASFGDDRMLIEKFIENPHHIEIQVMADTHGNVIAFPERECSVQRRNQKVIEESPSCLIDPEMRREMQKQAIRLCKAVNYRSAGTIEMLADEKRNFYFLEMNTRLQVEHPITELVTKEDLVEHMLWVAAGKKLPKHLLAAPDGCLSPVGWAMESRVYAEDPMRNFLPSIGPLITYKQPEEVHGEGAGGKEGPVTVRIDTGVYEGGTISMYYDPMISKLITHAPTRPQALLAMENALDRYVVNGLGNNISFLRDVCRNERFMKGKYTIKFIEEEYPKGFHGVQLNERENNELITIAAMIHESKLRLTGDTHDYSNPKLIPHGYEYAEDEARIEECVVVLGGPKGKAYHVVMDMLEEDLEVKITPMDGKHKASKLYINQFHWASNNVLASAFFSAGPGKKKEGVPAALEEKVVQMEGVGSEGYHLRLYGSQQYVIVRSMREHELASHMLPPVVRDVSNFLLCPMPGSLISLSAQVGQHVVAGQQLAVVEAMKMQNVLRAEKNGVIKAVHCKAGDRLAVDHVLIEFEKPSA